MDVIQFQKPYFFENCSICHGDLDGAVSSGGEVCISKRCFHVFHEVCIKKWLTEENDTCPNCNLKHFAVYELLPNPEYVEEYQKWQDSPENYEIDTPQNIRPLELRGLKRREKLTPAEVREYFRSRNIQVQNLGDNCTQEEMSKAGKEAFKAHGMMLVLLKEESQKITQKLNVLVEQNAQQIEDLAKIEGIVDQTEKNNAHRHLIQAYNKKADDFEKKIETEKDSLKKQKPRPNQKISEIHTVSMKLSQFSRSFSQAGHASPTFPDKPSIEESRELLKQVDGELDAYLESLPEDVKAILRRPLPRPVQPNQVPLQSNQQPSNNIPPNPWPSRKTLVKVAFVGAGVLLIYCLWKSGQSKKLPKNIKLQKPDL